MANGIDQEIQSKVDAYRGNPQALQQRYAQNQQLVDLLALQKLKSEKEAAAREMQMQMQQQPQTIKQQREAELLGMTKQEMMQQTQGILQQRQAEQQKNMQRVAQGGIGALAGQRPAAPQQAPQGPQGQPMPKMAGGGIVAFQAGGLNSMQGLDGEKTLEEQIAIIRRRTDLNEGQKQSLINQIRAQQPREEARRQFTTPVGRASSARMPGVMGNIPVGSETNTLDVLSETRPQIAPPRAAQGAEPDLGGLGMGPPQRLGPRGQRAGIAALEDTPTAGPDDGLRGGPVPEAGSPETAAEAVESATTPSGVASLSEYQAQTGIGGGSADAAMQRGFQAADAYTGRAEKAGRYADMEAELRALDAELYDPDQDRRDQLKAFLAGTANTTNFGSTMAGGTVASLNLRRKQKAERRERLKDIFAMAERGMTLDATLAEGGLRLGQQMYADAMANQRAALSAAASMRNADLRAEIDRAQLAYNQLRDNRQFGLDERELGIKEDYNDAQVALAEAENDTRKFAAVSLSLDRIQDQELAIREAVVESSQLPALQGRLEFETDPNEIAKIEEAIRAEEAIVAIRAETIFDRMGGVEARDTLAAALLDLTGTGATMLNMEDVAGITREE